MVRQERRDDVQEVDGEVDQESRDPGDVHQRATCSPHDCGDRPDLAFDRALCRPQAEDTANDDVRGEEEDDQRLDDVDHFDRAQSVVLVCIRPWPARNTPNSKR